MLLVVAVWLRCIKRILYCIVLYFRSTWGQNFQRKQVITRSTQRAQTSAERQHNRIAQWFLQCKLAMQLWSESTRYFFDNPVNPDFGLRTPGSRRWSGSSPKFNHLVPGPCPAHQEISSKPVHNFSVIRRTDKQTRSKNITPFFGGGKSSARRIYVNLK